MREVNWLERRASRGGVSLIACAFAGAILVMSASAPAAVLPPITLVPVPGTHLKVAQGFKVQKLYEVPGSHQGSWVNMCTDPEGRLIVSDQYGSLYRVTPPPIGGDPSETKVERIPADIGEAQGLLWAFNSLYVVVNGSGKYHSGLYRVWDSNGDGQLDKVKLLRKLNGGGEHGPHAVVLSPDGKSLYIVCGDATQLTKIDGSRQMPVWKEDLLLPRIYGRGFMRGTMAPGGCVYQVDPSGKHWQLFASGFRNDFDIAFNRSGDLFAYDADMEWDMNTPWYRPTRLCFVVSGAEFGWRNGSGKWPPYFPDSVPPVVNIGPGSPTGLAFGYGAKFPVEYQKSLFMCDWSYGKMYIAQLTPKGASYTANFQQFMNGTPLDLTDVVINRKDGAMYFTIGGRRTQSALYRVTYVGDEPTPPVSAHGGPVTTAGRLRRRLESFQGPPKPNAVDALWPSLGSPDRFLRYTARVALEHQDPKEWQDRALKEEQPEALITACIALARVGDPSLQPRILKALNRINWNDLSVSQRLDLIRVYDLAFIRMGKPDEATRQAMIARFDPHYPSHQRYINEQLCELLVYLQAPDTARKSMRLLAEAPTQEEQIAYAKSLRLLTNGWTLDLRKAYFSWFLKAANYKGGASLGKFIQYIRHDAIAHLSEADKTALKPILEAEPKQVSPLQAMASALAGRSFVKQWTVADLMPAVNKGLHGRNFERGRKLFGAVGCFACHRFDNEGGAVGPDLTTVGKRFSPHDILVSIIQPSKEISDQYASTVIVLKNGKQITGRIINLSGDVLAVNTDMFDPNQSISVHRKNIKSMHLSKVSMMPEGLIYVLHKDEILDLLAYLVSGGNKNDPMFTQR